MAKSLTANGYSVTIIALHPDYSNLRPQCFQRRGVQICYAGQMHVRKTAETKTYFGTGRLAAVTISATINLTRALMGMDIDIVHIGKPHPMNAIAALIWAHYRHKPLVLDCDDDETASNRFGAMWQKSVVRLFENTVPHFASVITTSTSYGRRRLQSLGITDQRIVYLPNGVERERFCKVDGFRVEALRRRLCLPDKNIVIYVGSLSLISHPVDLLLEAFQHVRRIEPASRLLLVGGGEDYGRLQCQATLLGIDDAVHFIGRVPPEEVPLYYGLGNVSVDPVYDNDAARARLPLKLFESWASAIPFVTGDVGDRGMLLGDPPAGVLTRPGDPAALAKGILRPMLDSTCAIDLCRRGTERVQQFFWDRLVDRVESAYEQAHARAFR
jgi:glycosyltransferase involved in cell wall biosynthesis